MALEVSRTDLEEKNAAVALAGFAKKASDSGLPNSASSRKQWDRVPAAPPSDHGMTFAPAAAAVYPSPPSTTYADTQDLAAATVGSVSRLNGVASSAPLQAHAVQLPPPWQYPHYSQLPLSQAPSPAPATQRPTAEATAQGSLHQINANQLSMLMYMSSFGFGVAPATSLDATEAAIRAVQDSMERSAIRLPTSSALGAQLSIHIKLGVPQTPAGEAMHVDVSRLYIFLPESIPLLPVEVVLGGLLIDHGEAEGTSSQYPNSTICAAVACVSFQQSNANVSASSEQPSTLTCNQAVLSTDPETPSNAVHSAPCHWTGTAHAAQAPSLPPPLPPPNQHHHTTSQPPPSTYHHHVPSHHVMAPPQHHQHRQHHFVHRSNSMEVLAQVSGELRDKHFGHTSVPSQARQRLHSTTALALVCSAEAKSLGMGGEVNAGDREYNYKKLAPGVTPKNNKRLFVKHEYRDFSHEEPLPEEQFLVGNDARTPNAAFPLKLHEALQQIEKEGLNHIIGWMPHGRSFKIHQQQEFVDVILPKYFVMTKKSSFLRQLNLYNFNRISVGPDSGSYYHEKFLRGLKFLCRRMSRQKINGNGIRAAGNPDEEPALVDYPVCPPSLHPNNDSSDSEPCDETSDTLPIYHVPSEVASPTQQNIANNEATMMNVESPNQNSNVGGTVKRTSNRGVRLDNSSVSAASFPLKLQRILDKADAEGKTDVVSWLPHGHAFLVHDVDRFVSEVMCHYFNQTKYSSFQRQLHMYNFQRITFGRDKGAYHHEKFHRGRPDLCMTMVRTRVNGKGCRRPGDPDNEPDFYEREYAPTIAPGSEVEIPTETSSPGDNFDDEASDMHVEGVETTSVAV